MHLNIGKAEVWRAGDPVQPIDTPASAQMTESFINTNTRNGRMRVEGRVTRPSKSTPTDCRYAVVMRNDKEQQVLEL